MQACRYSNIGNVVKFSISHNKKLPKKRSVPTIEKVKVSIVIPSSKKLAVLLYFTQINQQNMETAAVSSQHFGSIYLQLPMTAGDNELNLLRSL